MCSSELRRGSNVENVLEIDVRANSQMEPTRHLSGVILSQRRAAHLQRSADNEQIETLMK